jgi:hypothetical protein
MILQPATRVMPVPHSPYDSNSSAEPETTSVRATTLGLWRSFGAELLVALHESRERQAAREIEYHRHLIETARAYKLNRPEPRPQAGGTAVKIAIVATIAVLGLLHILGATMLERSAQGRPTTVTLSGD